MSKQSQFGNPKIFCHCVTVTLPTPKYRIYTVRQAWVVSSLAVDSSNQQFLLTPHAATKKLAAVRPWRLGLTRDFYYAECCLRPSKTSFSFLKYMARRNYVGLSVCITGYSSEYGLIKLAQALENTYKTETNTYLDGTS